MEIAKTTVFIGIRLDDEIEKAIHPGLMRLFGSYFDKKEMGGSFFLGKAIDEAVTLEQLEQCGVHLQSLYKRVMPSISLQPLSCFALTQ